MESRESILLSKSDQVILTIANNQTAKERFDLGEGANMLDYLKVVALKKAMLNEDSYVQEKSEEIKSRLNKLKNSYL
jgi:hypothetical protein